MSRPASSPLEVLAVEVAPPGPRLRGCYLGVPKPGEAPDARELLLRGWVLGEEEAALGIEVLDGEHVLARAPVGLARPDIAAQHPDLPYAATSGFELALNLRALTGALKLGVRAVLSPICRTPIASLSVRAATREDRERVTVVIPCFEQAHFLAEAIESVLGQTHSQVEIVVVDDGSRDNAGEVAARYPGVRYLRQPNSGVAAARNAGLEQAEGEFVVFLDSDDRLLPGAIARGVRELRADPEAVMAAGAWQLIGEGGEALPSVRSEPPDDAYRALLECCFISTPAAVIYRRRLFDEIGDFNPAVSASADYDLYLRAAARFPVRAHGDIVAEYRRHGANMTRDPALVMRSEIAVLRRQAGIVGDRPELREARRRGVRRARTYHGRHLVAELRRHTDNGHRGRALRAAARLTRAHPLGFPDALRALRRRGSR